MLFRSHSSNVRYIHENLGFWIARCGFRILCCSTRMACTGSSIIRSVLGYASPAWAGLTQYLSDQIESIQKRALKIIFPSLCYEDVLKKSGLILLRQRREDACITFLKRGYSSSDLLRSLVPRVAHTRPYALRTGESVSVPASSRTNRFGNFCTIKYQNHV